MAKDNKWMAVDLGNAQDPVAPNAALLEQAGAARGQAAKIAGESNAAALEFVGKLGKDIYESYQYSEAAKEAKSIMTGVSSPEFTGEDAYKKMANVKRLAEQERGILSAGDSPSAEFMKEVEQAKGAVNSGVISSVQARAFLAAKMRERIAANPGASPWIRKAFQEYSGAGDWDIQELQGAFKKPEADKRAEELAKAAMDADKSLANHEEVQVVFGQRYGLFGGDVIKAFQGPQGDYYKRQANDIRAADVATKAAKRAAENTALGNDVKGEAAGIAAVLRANTADSNFYATSVDIATKAGQNMNVLMSDPKAFSAYFTKNKGLLLNAAAASKRAIDQEIATLTITPGAKPLHLEELKRKSSQLDKVLSDQNYGSFSMYMQTWMTTSKFATDQANVVQDTINKALQAAGATGEVWGDFLNMRTMAQSPNATERANGQRRLDAFKKERPSHYATMEHLATLYQVNPTHPDVLKNVSTREAIEKGGGPDRVGADDKGAMSAVLAAKMQGFKHLNTTLGSTDAAAPSSKEQNNIITYALKSASVTDVNDLRDINVAVSGANAPIDKWLSTLSDVEKKDNLKTILDAHARRYVNPDSQLVTKVKGGLANINDSLKKESATTPLGEPGFATQPSGAATQAVGSATLRAVSPALNLYVDNNGWIQIGISSAGGTPQDYRSFNFSTSTTANLRDLQRDVDAINNGTAIYAAISSRLSPTTTQDVRNKLVKDANEPTPIKVEGTKPITGAAPTSTVRTGNDILNSLKKVTE